MADTFGVAILAALAIRRILAVDRTVSRMVMMLAGSNLGFRMLQPVQPRGCRRRGKGE